MKKKLSVVGAAALSTCALLLASTNANAQPDPAELLERAEAAHGGRDALLAIPALRLRYAMHLTSLAPDASPGRNWSMSWRYYDTVIEPATSRAYVNSLLLDRPGPEAGFDGKEIWDSNVTHDVPDWKDPAWLRTWYHYGMVALPLLVQRDGAALSYEGTDELPGHPHQHHIVKVDYEPAGGQGSFTLYLDEESGMMHGWKQGTMMPPLPGLPDVAFPPAPPLLRVADSFLDVGEVTLVRAYVSYTPGGDGYTAFHLLAEAEILDAFDAAQARPPEGVLKQPIAP